MQLLMRLWRLFKRFISSLRKQIALKKSIKVKLRNDFNPGEPVLKIKEETLEKMNFMKVYKHIEGGEIVFRYPEITLNKYHNALVFPYSDFIITENVAVWPKTKYAHFQKIKPLDKDLLRYVDQTLYVKKPDSIINVKCAFSLCGVHSSVWSHFLIQYLPKTKFIKDIIKLIGSSLTLVTPEYEDHQINEIINSVASHHKINVVKLIEGQSVQCDILYHIENMSIISDHSSYISPSDVVIPDITLQILKENFINDSLLFPELTGSIDKPYRKIFLSRKVSTLSPLGGVRNMENQKEVESYFVNEGFEIVYPHEFNLNQKAKIFSEANTIVGVGSSAFTNIIFCQPGTKVLAFGNYQRIYDLYLSRLAHYFGINLRFLVEKDIEPYNINSSYNISLIKVIEAYQSMIK